MAFLVFQLKAPLASFGDSAGDTKTTALRPRKSAVLGLVGAALGIDRSESSRFRELINSFKFAVVVLSRPQMMTDYHTLRAPQVAFVNNRKDQILSGEGSTSLVHRDYLQNGHWLVALEGSVAHLSAVQAALNEPRYTLYLGRKSCALSAYTAPVLVEEAGCVSEAFAQWLAQVPEVVKPKVVSNLEMAWERGMLCQLAYRFERRVSDVRTSLQNNFFSPRQELEGTFEYKGV